MAKIISLKELYNILKNKVPSAHETAEINTLNALAGGTAKEVRKEVAKSFTLRNDYTVGSIRFDKATKNKLCSVAFTTAEYMGYHEVGESLGKNLWGTSEEYNPISTSHSRGGNYKGVLKNKYRFNQMGKIGTSDDKTSTHGFFEIKRKRDGKRAIYERVGKKIKTVRILEEDKPIKRRAFFDKASDKILNKHDAYKSYEKSMNTTLP